MQEFGKTFLLAACLRVALTLAVRSEIKAIKLFRSRQMHGFWHLNLSKWIETHFVIVYSLARRPAIIQKCMRSWLRSLHFFFVGSWRWVCLCRHNFTKLLSAGDHSHWVYAASILSLAWVSFALMPMGLHMNLLLG